MSTIWSPRFSRRSRIRSTAGSRLTGRLAGALAAGRVAAGRLAGSGTAVYDSTTGGGVAAGGCARTGVKANRAIKGHFIGVCLTVSTVNSVSGGDDSMNVSGGKQDEGSLRTRVGEASGHPCYNLARPMSTPGLIQRLIELVGDFPPGSVSLVGAGPGDAGLISVRGAVRLAQAEVVLHDLLVGPELLDTLGPDCQRIFVGKARSRHHWRQEQINEALVEHARAGRRVVRLKGGDPFVFGRGGEECEYLAGAGIPFEVVPGITAAFGAPATAGIPLTHRGIARSFALVTGHADPGRPPPDYAALARLDTIAVYMGLANLAEVCRRLTEGGRRSDTPAAVIEWGTRRAQRTLVGTLESLPQLAAQAGIGSPAMILIGEVVRVRETIEWFERRPLHGQTIMVTRMRDQAAALSRPLASLGAEVIQAPTIELQPIEDYAAVDEALRQVSRYAWLVLTSTNGVDAFGERLAAIGADARQMAGVRIAAVGQATAARLAECGLRADLVPPEAVGESLAVALTGQVAGSRVLLLRAQEARPELVLGLRQAGASCDDLPVYRTGCSKSLPRGVAERLEAGGIGWITLTSPSSLGNLMALLGPDAKMLLGRARLASIGPVTTKAIRAAGLEAAVEAQPHDVPGLVAAIRAAVEKHA